MRPRERYRCHGPDPFGDAELVALVLGTGAAGRSATEIGAGLLARFGDLRHLARAQVPELLQVPGVGPARAIRLHAALQLGRRSVRVADEPLPVVRTPSDAWRLLGPGLRDLPTEELHALYLDRRNQPLGLRALTRGSDGFTVVDPRQVFLPAVGLSATGVVLAHNHPSGDPAPSEQDRDVTRRVAAAGRVLGIGLLDHLVCGRTQWTSMADQGLLPAW